MKKKCNWSNEIIHPTSFWEQFVCPFFSDLSIFFALPKKLASTKNSSNSAKGNTLSVSLLRMPFFLERKPPFLPSLDNYFKLRSCRSRILHTARQQQRSWMCAKIFASFTLLWFFPCISSLAQGTTSYNFAVNLLCHRREHHRMQLIFSSWLSIVRIWLQWLLITA